MRSNQHFRFQDLNKDQLWDLRTQIVLNSIFISDYEHTFEFDPDDICGFFDGYLEYIYELTGDDSRDVLDVIREFDTPDSLFEYYWGLDSEYLCSINYTPEWDSEDDLEYQRYWNGIDPPEEEE